MGGGGSGGGGGGEGGGGGCDGFSAALVGTDYVGGSAVGTATLPLADCCAACVATAGCHTFVEFAGVWRIGNYDNHHLSVAHKDGKTAVVWRRDGTWELGPLDSFSTYEKSAGGPVMAGEGFLQFGTGRAGWRFADMTDREGQLPKEQVPEQDKTYLSISWGRKTGVICHDEGFIYGGPRDDYHAASLPIVGPAVTAAAAAAAAD